jgi:hypothetical protein
MAATPATLLRSKKPRCPASPTPAPKARSILAQGGAPGLQRRINPGLKARLITFTESLERHENGQLKIFAISLSPMFSREEGKTGRLLAALALRP